MDGGLKFDFVNYKWVGENTVCIHMAYHKYVKLDATLYWPKDVPAYGSNSIASRQFKYVGEVIELTTLVTMQTDRSHQALRLELSWFGTQFQE